MAELSLEQFSEEVSQIMPTLMREFAKQHSESFYKIRITMPQFVVLNILQKRGEVGMSDLAAALAVTTAAMTGVVERLVREGYAVRLSDPADRRVVRVKMTSKGAKAVKSV